MPDSVSTIESTSQQQKDESWAEWSKNQAAWRVINGQGKRWLGVSGCYHVRKKNYD